ncbi:MAG: hypothetical protein HY680_06860 [Chloroflexi bacterium]|nr:hypothetical protein [Chloroflexota bacterium]
MKPTPIETMMTVKRPRNLQVRWRGADGVMYRTWVQFTVQGNTLKVEIEHEGNVEVDAHVPSL